MNPQTEAELKTLKREHKKLARINKRLRDAASAIDDLMTMNPVTDRYRDNRPGLVDSLNALATWNEQREMRLERRINCIERFAD